MKDFPISKNKAKFFFIYALVIFSIGCKTASNPIISQKNKITKDVIIFDEVVTFEENTVFEKEVIIYPEALLKTKKNVKIIFNNKVTILGNSQVFDNEVNVIFSTFTISELNVSHFGANGIDNISDDKQIQKVFDIATNLSSSVDILFPIGKYTINNTLKLNNRNNPSSVNLIGMSTSLSGTYGSSLLWNSKDRNGSIIEIENVKNAFIKNLDFNIEGLSFCKHNIYFKPFCYQIKTENCSFGGVAGQGSCNINLNICDHRQVSEMAFNNCKFSGYKSTSKLSESAIRGGLSNTKNFYITNCIFMEYSKSAIDINTSDILIVKSSTYSNNDIDIFCGVAGAFIEGNYSEGSLAFFSSTLSGNLSNFTLISNFYCGFPKDGYAIRDGSGKLVLINNNFGGCNNEKDKYRIKWEDGINDAIISKGNFFQNNETLDETFYNRSNQKTKLKIESSGDMGGQNIKKRPFSEKTKN